MEYKRLKDFADEHGVTVRSIQRHVQRHESELSGHIKRYGAPKGTYLDSFAQSFIADHLLQDAVAIVDTSLADENERLQAELNDTRERLLAAQNEINTLLRDKLELTERAKDAENNRALADAAMDTLRDKLEHETARADAAEEITGKLKNRSLWERITRRYEN